MTNDITTLNGALAELGETMADNLVTMGVTDADASDGLTTLANKILDVPQGASTITVELATDKSALSYYDSETATLSATVKENNIVKSGVTVEFFMNGISMGTSTTNASGIATKTYSSIGVGTPSFTATANNVGSESVTIEDCLRYAETERYHTISSSSATRTDVFESNYYFDNTIDWEVSFDMKVTANGQRIDIIPSTKTTDNHIGIGRNGNGVLSIYAHNPNSSSECQSSQSQQSISTNTYYSVVIKKVGTTVSFKFDNVDLSHSCNTSWLSNFEFERLRYTQWVSGTTYLKNIKIKVLNPVSLSTSQSILSYNDSDSTTLTASLGNSAVGETVQLYDSNDNLIGTMTDNEDGTYSYTYNSQGTGDKIFYAKWGNYTSDNLTIEDCFRYDDASSDKTSNYSTSGISSFTHSTDHYEAVRTSTTNFYSPIYIDETLPTDFEMSVDINGTFSGSSHQEMLTFGTNHPITYSGTSEIGIVSSGARYGLFKRISGTFTAYTTSASISSNTWYTFIVKRVGTSVTAKILNNQGTEIHNATQTISEAPNYNKWNLIVGDSAYTLKWKNLKIKSLGAS